MGQLLKQSTAVNITVLMVDSTDHVTGKTGLTLTIYATKAAGTPATITPTVTELDSTNVKGLYKLALTTGHTDTLGELQLHVTATGADPTDVTHQVVAVDLGDSVRLGLTALPNAAAGATNGLPLAVDSSGRVDVLKINGTSQTARDIGASVLVGDKTGFSLTGAQVNSIAATVWEVLTASLSTVGTIGKKLADWVIGTAQTGDAYARLGAPAGASVSADIASVYSRIGAPAGASIAADIAAITPSDPSAIADAVWDEAISGHLSSGSTGASLNAAGSAGDPWATALPGAYGSGTAGKIVGDNLNATVSSRLASASYTAPDNSDIAAIKAKTDNLPASPAAVGDIPTANQNADALLDRAAGVETNRTLRQAMRLMLAALAGKLSGAATTSVVIRDTNDTVNRISATVDSNGNRTAVTYDAS